MQAIGRAAIMAVLLAAPADAAEPVRYPPETVLLFAAAWCAPCRAELARLEEIGAAARPYRVQVVAYDDLPATRAMIEGLPAAARWTPDRASRRAVLREVTELSSGLPFALAVDAQGRRCASARAGLDAASTAALVARCRSRA